MQNQSPWERNRNDNHQNGKQNQALCRNHCHGSHASSANDDGVLLVKYEFANILAGG